jgi:hypothetical protein
MTVSRFGRLRVAVLAGAWLVFATVCAFAQAPAGAEFQVNTYSTGNQQGADIGTDAAGNFVVIWTGAGDQDGSGTGVFGQRFSAEGSQLGGEFQVNTYTTDDQGFQKVAVDTAGNFVVTWVRGALASQDVVAQRYDNNGMMLGGEFVVNTYTSLRQTYPDVAMDGLGNFVIVWASYQQDGSGLGVFGQRYAGNGSPVGGEFAVNTTTVGDQSQPRVAASSTGRFVVAWHGPDASGSGVFARLYDSGGVPDGVEFPVNLYTTGDQMFPQVAYDPSGEFGGFTIVWDDHAGADGSGHGVFRRRFYFDSTGLENDALINVYTTGNQDGGTLAMDAAGNGVIFWSAQNQFDQAVALVGQRFDSGGNAVGTMFLGSGSQLSLHESAAVAGHGAERYVVVWNDSNSQDGDSAGVFGQRFVPSHGILGKKLIVKDPTGAEDQRLVLGFGKESPTDIGSFVGDPTLSGAELFVMAHGTTNSTERYVLDASGWRAISTGYKYTGPTGPDGDPVRKVILKRTPSGKTLLKVLLKGTTGSQPLDVLPPNTATSGGFVLTLGGGDGYCVGFGGTAGGAVSNDTAQQWKVVDAVFDWVCPIL